MRISLDEMEQDINKNGFTEKFSQGNQEPYLRQRPHFRYLQQNEHFVSENR